MRLLLRSLNPRREDIQLKEGDLRFGRRDTCHIHLPDERISGLHCIVRVSGDSRVVEVEDCSTNGTFVNSEKVGRGNRRRLVDGDEVSLVAKRDELDKTLTEKFVAYILQIRPEDTKEERDPVRGSIEVEYALGEVLGRGNYATVRRCSHRKSGVPYAVKTIPKKKFLLQPVLRSQVMAEVEILRAIRHTNIIAINDVFEDDKNIHLVLELVTGGELSDRLLDAGGRLSEPEARRLLRQVLQALDFLHGHNILHRDLKPDNILLQGEGDNALVKLSDFGLAKSLTSDQGATTMCGTPYYLAPEIIRKEEYGTPIDMWSFGAMMYTILCGHPPFSDATNTAPDIFEAILVGKVEFKDATWGSISDGAKDLLRHCLTVDPNKRFTAKQALDHCWFQVDFASANAASHSSITREKTLRSDDSSGSNRAASKRTRRR